MPLVKESLAKLEEQEKEKIEVLSSLMPKVEKLKTCHKPKNTHKKDGTLSVAGERWFNRLRRLKLPPTHSDPVKDHDKWEEPNPGSPQQVKAWLETLGWKPRVFDYKKNDDGSERRIPQVRKDGELSPCVVDLIDDNPDLIHLDGLTVIQHRKGIFKAFLEKAVQGEDGEWYLKAQVGGFTNTLRFRHKKPLVNLPGVGKAWGKEIRSSLLAPVGGTMVGADMVSLESTTKRHYIYPHDPDYAEEMSEPGFDEHLDLAVKAGAITREEYFYYVEHGESTEEGKRIHEIRKKFKPVNYSAVYGVGVPKLSRDTGMSRKEAGALLTAYWERNWAVKKVAEEQFTKESHGYVWLKNPVSGFYHELRYDKDRFSTLNQSTGVYLFDSWLARCMARGYKGSMQFHDETAGPVTNMQQTEEIMKLAIDQTNRDITLNVELGIDMKFGQNYAEVH